MDEKKLEILKYWLTLANNRHVNEDRLFSERASYIVLFSSFLVLGWQTALLTKYFEVSLAISAFGFLFNLIGVCT